MPDPPPIAGAALRVGVHQQHPPPRFHSEDGEVYCQGGLSGASLAGEQCEGPHGRCYFAIMVA